MVWRQAGGLRWRLAAYLAVASVLLLAASSTTVEAWGHQPAPKPTPTSTPIKHLVVLFQENVSFDHYFGTYPNATNTDGTPFHAQPNTPKVNGLTPALLNDNPNEYNPQRLSPSEALTCDQNHNYTPEQQAFDGGKMDQFVQDTAHDTCTGQPILYGAPGLVMDYYDGNTVTAEWNYAQHYAMSDAAYDTEFGPSTPSALDLISGDTSGASAVDPNTGKVVSDPSTVAAVNSNGIGTDIGDADPYYDQCSDSNHTTDSPTLKMTGKNVGNLLNQRGVTWGWFQGGFAPTGTSNGVAQCNSEHENVGGQEALDYSPHHNPFEFYQSTANPKHLAPSSESMIGRSDQANHEYDLSDFYTSLKDGNMPSVSFLKAPEYQDGHAGYSDPLDEQTYLVNTINAIEQSKFWSSTAIVITYDDSDGWYDQMQSPIVNGSHDATNDVASECGTKPAAGGVQDRCGYGPRLPFLVISPYSRTNFVGSWTVAQTSITKFIEENWFTGRIGGVSYDASSGSMLGFFDFARPHFNTVLLNPKTGAVVRS
ncbi:MAG TPA: alkaline phosphatase family protein [Candidatus Dormibacteraeota bacterium]|jgi:phospholipase C|nr:alkaline phosphatase family protein [Candidatus Dormibacteraeota bacterium]